MREQVGNAEYRVVFVLAYVYCYFSAVSLDDNAMQRERNGRPLVLLDAAVVVGLEVSYLVLFVERVLLHVEARGVDMSRNQVHAVLNGLLADNSQDNGLLAVEVENLVAGLVLVLRTELNESARLRHLHDLGGSLALSLCDVQERLVALAELIALLQFLLGHAENCVLLVRKQLFL